MIKIFLREQIWKDSIDLVIFKNDGEKRYIAKPIVFEEFPNGGFVETPTAQFHSDDRVCEQLKNELQIMGMIDNADSSTIEAIKYHLEDMRDLVMRKNRK